MVGGGRPRRRVATARTCRAHRPRHDVKARAVKIRIGYGLGTNSLTNDEERFGRFVDELERLRFDSLWVSERISGHSPDPVVAMAFCAGRTSKLKFGMSVMVLPGPQPGAGGQAAGHPRPSVQRPDAAGLRAGRAEPGRVGRVLGGAQGARPDVRRGAAADPPAVDARTPSPTTDASTTSTTSRCCPSRSQTPPDVWLGGAGAVRAAPGGAAGRRVAAVLHHAGRRGRRHRHDQADRRGARPGDRRRSTTACSSPTPPASCPRLHRGVARARRPDVDPTDIVPSGIAAVRRTIGGVHRRGRIEVRADPGDRDPTTGPASSRRWPPSSSRCRPADRSGGAHIRSGRLRDPRPDVRPPSDGR